MVFRVNRKATAWVVSLQRQQRLVPFLTKIHGITGDYQILHKTLFAEARGEPELGQQAVVWVIKNRVDQTRGFWGGNTLAGVCLHPAQFECWNPDRRHLIDEGIRNEPAVFRRIDAWLPSVYLSRDPTSGCDHYNNPDKEGFPLWTNNVIRVIKIGNHQFYRSK